jgi:hypothetical protein
MYWMYANDTLIYNLNVEVGVIIFILVVLCYQMNLLLKEYLLSGDGKEAERCLRELEVPHFHHEFVYEVKYQAVHKAMHTCRRMT